MKIIIYMVMSVMMIVSVLMPMTYASAAGEISTAGTRIIKALLWIGYAVAFGMLIFIGIKYILGAADTKANMKKSVTNWVIGAIIIFTVTTIVGAVLSIIGVTGSTDSKSLAQTIVDTFSLN